MAVEIYNAESMVRRERIETADIIGQVDEFPMSTKLQRLIPWGHHSYRSFADFFSTPLPIPSPWKV